MNYKNILFDLDGTLTDPKVGITRGVAYALASFGIKEDPDSLTRFIGPPLKEAFMDYYGFDAGQAMEAIKQYRVYFSDIGIFENELYDGIPEMLKRLKTAGKTLLVASSKPTVFVERILEHFQINECFSFVAGSELDGRRTDKADVIGYVTEAMGLRASDCIMVGDREHDVLGAKKRGMDSVGVLFGYGTREELEAAGATAIAATVAELGDLLQMM